MPGEGRRQDGNAAGQSADGDLAAGLAALSRLSSASLSLNELLSQVASLAVQAIPGAEGVGLTLFEADRANTIVHSAPFVRDADDIQYALGEGPCITAAATGKTLRSGSLGTDPRWPRFGPRMDRLRVRSVLSLPLQVGDTRLGALNVYAHSGEAFDDRAEELGRTFAVPAAISVQNAQLLAQARRLAEHLQSALTTRAVIDQAIGIVMGMSGVSADEAFTLLRLQSQRQNLRVAVVAQRIVQDAVLRGQKQRPES